MAQAATGGRARALAALAIGAGVLIVAVTIAIVAWRLADDRDDPDRGDGRSTLAVGGKGEASVEARAATFRVELVGRGTSPGEALLSWNVALRRAQLSLARAGVNRSELVTEATSTIGMRMSHTTRGTLVVRVEDLGEVGGVVGAIGSLRTGVTGVLGPMYDYGATNRLEEQALDEAVASARRKADQTARRTGMRVDGVRSIEIGGVEVERPEYKSYAYPAADAVSGAGSADEGEVIPPRTGGGAVGALDGSGTVRSTVNVVFHLERA